MSKGYLRWGLLSTAHINRRLIPAIRSAERAELVAVASRDEMRAKAYAADWGIPRALGSYEALLDDPEIDVVYISLPNKLHAEWAVRAAQAGKHVLCEKPLATTVADVDRIIGAARSSGVILVEAVMYLHHPLLARARQLVQEGAVGEVTLVRGAFSFFLDRQDDVRWNPELDGGSLWDVGSYPVSFIRRMAGEPEAVLGWQTLDERGVDRTFAGLLRFRSGILGLFDSGFHGHFRMEAEVVGTAGALIVDRPYIVGAESRILLRTREGQEEITVPEANPYQCEVEALNAAVLDGAELPVPLSSSRANVATLVALYESARQGRPISL
jgi:xylose dehydrogenase (NAD/NADP)